MAVDYNEFCYTNAKKEGKSLISGLKANEDFTKFLYVARIEGKQIRKVINLTKLQLNKKASIKRANDDAEKFFRKKEEEIMTASSFTLDTKFRQLAEEYVKNKCKTGTQWTSEKEKMLEHYIYPHFEKTKASAIKEMNIDKIRVSMETSGVWRQNKNGCSPRTIRKVLLQVLKPILEYGYRNGALKRIPEIDVPKKPKKKIVKNGEEKIITLYGAIHSLYEYEPFYRGLFLFALFGRRWNEIRTLQWSDIDFIEGKYTVRAENSKIDEDKTFTLPKDVIEALIHFQEEKGLVFRSPKTGRELSTPKKQMEKLREASGIEGLTLHYFRHIMATALGELGLENTVLSASLGHNNSATVDDYYRTPNHLRGSEEATQAIEHIVEVDK